VKKLFALCIAISFGLLAHAQTYKFRTYSEAEGLSSRYVYTINQDANGYLFIGTSEGLFRFDGLKFKSFTRKDSLANDHIETSFITPQSNIWFGHNNGEVSFFQKGKITPFHLGSIVQSKITDLVGIGEDHCWVASQNHGLIELQANGTAKQYSKGIEEFNVFSMHTNDGKTFWIGTDLGLQKATINGDQVTAEMVADFPLTNVTDIKSLNDKTLIVATEDQGIFLVSTTQNTVEPLRAAGMDLSTLFIKEVRIDNDKNLWLCTNANGLVELSQPDNGVYTKVARFNDLGNKDAMSARTSFIDRENNLWIGSIGNGLLKLEDNYFSLYTKSYSQGVFAIQAIDTSLYIGTQDSILISDQDPANVLGAMYSNLGIPQSRITSILKNADGTLWIGTSDKGLWRNQTPNGKFAPFRLSDDNLNKNVNGILSVGDLVYVATDYGAYVIQGKNILQHVSIENGLSGNVVHTLYADKNGRIWLGTTTGEFAYLENNELRFVTSPIPNSAFAVQAFTQDEAGDIWVGTDGFGIMNITASSPIGIQKAEGLYSDFCYSLICDSKNHLWIGHRGAISRVNLATFKIDVFHPDSEDEIAFIENAVLAMSEGVILFGTDKGILRYDASKDKINSTEPLINFDSIVINDSSYQITDEIHLPYGEYKIEFSFVGISFKDPHKVTYQYILEGNDIDWSPISTLNFARYPRLDPGEYTFKIKAFNSDGIGGTIIKEFKITIDQPFWMKWWFFIVCGFIIFLSIRYIVFRRERFLRENQEYLQRELNSRTKEVVVQKEMLEAKNKDILDSIMYAKNIQNAILPPQNTLSQFFQDSFVYFKPRDIVSGDFYWVYRAGDRVLIACADCTGHGVPGAFMSLIGSTLLKEVSRMSSVNSPEDIMSTLDGELFDMLNKQSKEIFTDDGMDISIVEFNMSTQYLRIASANRPVLIYRDQELIEVRGDRHAIGGSSRLSERKFTQHEIKLRKGDSFYLFSDGITDQFGGPKGKKWKKSGLLEVVQNVVAMPMSQQEEIITQKFNDWKGNLPQLDDVIFIGIKI
jgi:ligand-binding sensor domain-containing protein/serine phosphatase RsbU (regulator of sigma subunit)